MTVPGLGLVTPMNNTKHKLSLGEAVHALTPHTEPGKLEMLQEQIPEILLQ